VLMQAAIPAHCFDPSYTNYSRFINAETNSHTPDIYRGYPGNIAAAVRGQIFNFLNTNDFALATGVITNGNANVAVNWEANEVNFKPNDGYSSDGTNCFQNISLGQYRAVTDPREQMPFVVRPRSKAAGAAPGTAGVVLGGQVDLKGAFGFNTDKSEHS